MDGGRGRDEPVEDAEDKLEAILLSLARPLRAFVGIGGDEVGDQAVDGTGNALVTVGRHDLWDMVRCF